MTPALKSLLRQPLRVVRVQQNSPAWLKLRKDFWTASETPSVMGLSPWTTPGQLALQKYSGVEVKQTAAMQHGHKYEDEARKALQRHCLLRFNPAVVTRGKFLASLDGWSEDRLAIGELKCPFSGRRSDTWIAAESKEIPEHYYAQVMHQLMVSGAEVCHFFPYDTDTKQGIWLRFKRNLDFFEEILVAWADFEDRYGQQEAKLQVQ